MPLTVLSVGYPLFPAGVDSAGGAEQILSLVERGLTQAGCRSLVVAAEGSITAGKLFPGASHDGEITNEVRRLAWDLHRRRIRQALDNHSIDLIHFHGLDFYEYLPDETDVPVLTTLHLPVAWYPAWTRELPGVHFNFVSVSQARTTSHRFPVVLNGIDVAQYQGQQAKEDFLLTLARICPEKGIHSALSVAHAAGASIKIAGPVHQFPEHRQYFERSVLPLLDGSREWIGPVGMRQKILLMQAARCLLIPSAVAETSSLVAMEAISAGTPVVAFDSGALAEVVEHGRTGFIVRSEDEMVEAIQCVDEISPEYCRTTARERFDYRRMTSDYLELYRSVPIGNSISRNGVTA
jgi:glycosyltransferase involved in cell wall biosynthesis